MALSNLVAIHSTNGQALGVRNQKNTRQPTIRSGDRLKSQTSCTGSRTSTLDQKQCRAQSCRQSLLLFGVLPLIF